MKEVLVPTCSFLLLGLEGLVGVIAGVASGFGLLKVAFGFLDGVLDLNQDVLLDQLIDGLGLFHGSLGGFVIVARGLVAERNGQDRRRRNNWDRCWRECRP